ncbi:hypothetical protein NIES4073_48710 [Kalymmatonema gypsitolerans NIES-4073]|nr:hypothetical protein NIES4073_48710 [Scytonema sp. NIES-4073]
MIFNYNLVSVGELLNAILNVRRVPTTLSGNRRKYLRPVC